MSGVGVEVVVGLVLGRLSEFDEELSDIVGVFEEASVVKSVRSALWCS